MQQSVQSSWTCIILKVHKMRVSPSLAPGRSAPGPKTLVTAVTAAAAACVHANQSCDCNSCSSRAAMSVRR